MKFGSWTYDGFQVFYSVFFNKFTLDSLCALQVDLRHKDEAKDLAVVEIGIDLTEFYQSVEWDILSVPAKR